MNSNLLSFENTSANERRVSCAPTDANWDMSYLKTGTSTEYVLSKVFNYELPKDAADGNEAEASGDPVVEPVSGLRFATVDAMSKYVGRYVVDGEYELESPELVDIFFEERKLCKEGHRARAWLVPLDHWLEDGEEFEQEYSVPREFEATVEKDPHPGREEPIQEQSALQKVLADDNQPECPITGEPFQKSWDDELQDWVYLNAIRPDPAGPIYNATAYEKQTEQQKQLEEQHLQEQPPAKRIRTEA